MNYQGVTLDETLSEEAMEKALRPALMKVGEDKNIIPVERKVDLKIVDMYIHFKLLEQQKSLMEQNKYIMTIV